MPVSAWPRRWLEAARSRAFAPNPYTVSVGRPPCLPAAAVRRPGTRPLSMPVNRWHWHRRAAVYFFRSLYACVIFPRCAAGIDSGLCRPWKRKSRYAWRTARRGTELPGAWFLRASPPARWRNTLYDKPIASSVTRAKSCVFASMEANGRSPTRASPAASAKRGRIRTA